MDKFSKMQATHDCKDGSALFAALATSSGINALALKIQATKTAQLNVKSLKKNYGTGVIGAI